MKSLVFNINERETFVRYKHFIFKQGKCKLPEHGKNLHVTRRILVVNLGRTEGH